MMMLSITRRKSKSDKKVQSVGKSSTPSRIQDNEGSIQTTSGTKSFHRCKFESVLVTLFLLCTSFFAVTAASSSSSSSSSSNIEKMFHPPSVFKRRLRSWIIRKESQSKSTQRIHLRLLKSKKTFTSSNAAKGSFLTMERPTKERLFEWFGVEGEDPVQVLRCMIHRMQYNHNKVGITNPLLHIMSKDKYDHSIHLNDITQATPFVDEERLLFHVENPKSKKMLPVSSTVSSPSLMQGSDTVVDTIYRSTPMEQCWWPELQVSPNTSSVSTLRNRLLFRTHNPPGSSTRRRQKDDWRVIVCRKRVGKGRACYERVRDAALDWEFESADGTMGLLEVPATCPRGLFKLKQQQQQQQPQKDLPNLYRSSSRYTVQPATIEELMESSSSSSSSSSLSSFYRSLGASSRRLVSYSSNPLVGFLSDRWKCRLYAINPVMVVYDVVDQRAKDCTFTSTAYSTLKGHWLSGEERVSVALRDGSQDVDVEILSISRAGPSLWGKVVWPLVGKMQQTFFQQHLKHLEDTAATNNNDPGTFQNEDGAISGLVPHSFADY